MQASLINGNVQFQTIKNEQKKSKQKVNVAILTSDKIDFKSKLPKRDREGHFILTKDKNPPGTYCNCKCLCIK